MTEKDKKKYEDMAAKDRERYDKEMKDAGLSKDKKPENDGPKKPQSSYFLFAADCRDKFKKTHPDWKMGQIAKQTGEDWKNLDTKTKEKWEKKAAEDKERYEREKNDDKTAASSEAGGKAKPAPTKKAAAKPTKKTKKDTDAEEEEGSEDEKASGDEE